MTFSCILGDNREDRGFVNHAVTQARPISSHMAAVYGIDVELQWTSCRRKYTDQTWGLISGSGFEKVLHNDHKNSIYIDM